MVTVSPELDELEESESELEVFTESVPLVFVEVPRLMESEMLSVVAAAVYVLMSIALSFVLKLGDTGNPVLLIGRDEKKD
jgi:hypothetical protein